MREAHYGFRTGWRAERRTTLCFPCFRSELGRRQGALARRSGVDSTGLDATQAREFDSMEIMMAINSFGPTNTFLT